MAINRKMQYQLEEFVDTQNNHRTARALPALEGCVERMVTSLSRCGAEVSTPCPPLVPSLHPPANRLNLPCVLCL